MGLWIERKWTYQRYSYTKTEAAEIRPVFIMTATMEVINFTPHMFTNLIVMSNHRFHSHVANCVFDISTRQQVVVESVADVEEFHCAMTSDAYNRTSVRGEGWECRYSFGTKSDSVE